MGYVVKQNPIGIDIVINDVIESMYDSLIDSGWTDYEAYHRVYKNAKDSSGNFIPEAFVADSVNQDDYREVLFDDNKRSTSFFLTGDATTRESGNYKVPMSVIFQVNCQELYDRLVGRADEEARNDAIVAIEKNSHGVNITSIETSIPVVYSEFVTDNVTFTDMSPMHVFRINMDVLVDYSCDYYCTYPEGLGGYDYKVGSGMN